MVGSGDLQGTIRLTGEATLVVNMFVIKLWMWIGMCSLPNSDSFYQKINHISFKSKKVNDTGD